MLRGGAFKPRSSPYSFQGMGEAGLQLLREGSNAHDLKLVTEVMDASQIEVIGKYADIYQVGARNMQNYHLLRALGEVRKPVLLKRGLSATMEELLLSAEYILSGGNYNVILCERGIRTFETYTRNTFDIAAIPVIKKLSHLPMWGDPSHGTGRRDKVPPMARAAVAAGADGLLIEVHNDPEHALSDGAQSLEPEAFTQLMAELRIIAPAIGRRIAELEPTLTNRAVVIVLSDLHDPKALPALKQLGQKHDCVVLQFQDPAERHLRGALLREIFRREPLQGTLLTCDELPHVGLHEARADAIDTNPVSGMR